MKNHETLVFNQIKNAREIGAYLQGVLACIDSAFEGGVTREDALHHISGDIVTVSHSNGEVSGFSSTVFDTPRNTVGLGIDVVGCYLQGATVSKEAQGNGVYKQMNQMRIVEALKRDVPFIYTRTQNPRVEAGIQSALDAMQVKYSLERVLVPGCYGQMLTKSKPEARGGSFDELDYEAGDAYVLFFILD